MAKAQTRPVSLNRVVAAWVVALFAITGIGMAPLFFYQLDLSKLTFSSQIPLIVGIGIELTAYAPTLAAMAVAGLMLGGVGIKRLLRPLSSVHRSCFSPATSSGSLSVRRFQARGSQFRVQPPLHS